MYARNINLALLLLLLPTIAAAKVSNFASRSAFGVGIDGVLEAQPSSDFATAPASYSSKYSHAFGIQPFGDFGNFVIKGDFSLQYAPDASGAGTDTTGKYTESSSASIWTAGAILELIPYISKDHRERIFIQFGGGEGTAHVTNTRVYSAATNIEKDGSSTEYYLAGVGYEFFLIQNYSLALGAGYQGLNFKKFSYDSGVQVNGSAIASGAVVTSSNGSNKGLDLSGYYFNLALNLHF